MNARRTLRILGSAAMNCAWLACGRLDGWFEAGNEALGPVLRGGPEQLGLRRWGVAGARGSKRKR